MTPTQTVYQELNIYFFVKTMHLLFVMGWMACLFVLPRAILLLKHARDSEKETETIKSLSIKLFRFGFLMFSLALFFGVYLWKGYGMSGAWLHLKLALVACLFIYYLSSGYLLYKGIVDDKFLSEIIMRFYNEASLLFSIPIIYLAVSKTV